MKMIDYKGKYFILQDQVDDDGFDIEIGEMKPEEITDKFLKEHVEACTYYGIPPYVGKDIELRKRIDKIYKENESTISN